MPKSSKPTLSVDITVAKALLDQIGGTTTLHARVDGVELPSQTYTAEGNFTYQRDLPPSQAAVAEIEFWLDKSIAPTATDPRELGVIVRGAAIR